MSEELLGRIMVKTLTQIAHRAAIRIARRTPGCFAVVIKNRKEVFLEEVVGNSADWKDVTGKVGIYTGAYTLVLERQIWGDLKHELGI